MEKLKLYHVSCTLALPLKPESPRVRDVDCHIWATAGVEALAHFWQLNSWIPRKEVERVNMVETSHDAPFIWPHT